MHKHQCGYGVNGFEPDKGCGFIWEHDEPTAQMTSKEYDQRHVCPNCGRPDQRYRVGPFKEDEDMGWVGGRILTGILAAIVRRLHEEEIHERLLKQRK